MKEKTYTLPPVEIFDVLSAAEICGVRLPDSVEKWWKLETNLSEAEKEKKTTKKITLKFEKRSPPIYFRSATSLQ